VVVWGIYDTIKSIKSGEVSTLRVNKKPVMTTNKSMDPFGFWMVIIFRIIMFGFFIYCMWENIKKIF
jgi:hypothetical protein